MTTARTYQMTRKHLITAALIIGAAPMTMAKPVTLECKYFDTSKSPQTLREFGAYFYVIDEAAKTVQLQDQLLKSTWSTEEVRIEKELLSFQTDPPVTDFHMVTLNRINGSFAAYSQYRTATGQVVTGDDLERIASAKGLWNTFLGITPGVARGKCAITQRMF